MKKILLALFFCFPVLGARLQVMGAHMTIDSPWARTWYERFTQKSDAGIFDYTLPLFLVAHATHQMGGAGILGQAATFSRLYALLMLTTPIALVCSIIARGVLAQFLLEDEGGRGKNALVRKKLKDDLLLAAAGPLARVAGSLFLSRLTKDHGLLSGVFRLQAIFSLLQVLPLPLFEDGRFIWSRLLLLCYGNVIA